MKKTIYAVMTTEVNKRGEACGDTWDEAYSFDRDEAIEVARRCSADIANRGARYDIFIDVYSDVECEDGATARDAYIDWVMEQACVVPDGFVDFTADDDVDKLVEEVCDRIATNIGDSADEEDWRTWATDSDVKRAVGLVGDAYKSVLDKAKPRFDSFAFKARVLRKGLDLTQAQASEETSVPLRTIENWESGTSTPPSYVQTMYLKTLKESN